MTSVARTLFDLAGRLHPGRTERALDNALSHRLVELEAIRRMTIELARHGRTGSRLMRELLVARGASYIPMGSGLEARFYVELTAAGLPLPEHQVDLGGEAWIGRVDFYYPDVRLVVEVDSDRHHTSLLDRAADARRDVALGTVGCRVLRIPEALLDVPDDLVAQVRAARTAARSAAA